MIFVETKVFTKRVKDLLDDDEYAELQQCLADDPELGKLIKNSGGLRKLRWARKGGGKSGGYRVIYYYAKSFSEQRMVFIFGKNEQDNLTDEQANQLRKVIERW